VYKLTENVVFSFRKGPGVKWGRAPGKRRAVFVCVNVVYIFSFSEGEREEKTNLESSP
jgi:hypothetical protein